jgi:hypothetical protein
MSDAIGPIRKSTPSGRGVRSVAATPGSANVAATATYAAKHANESASAGRKAPRIFAISSSTVVGGGEQRLERARLLLADDAGGGERHGRRHRRQHQQHEELLKERRLDGRLRPERPRRRLLTVEFERDPEVGRVRQPLAGERRHHHRDEKRQQRGDGPGEETGEEEARASAQVGELLAEQRRHAGPVHERPPSRRRR